MIINDRIYGKEEINEPVLVDLLHSPSMQRLKGINQLGIPDRYYFELGFSRYEHSVGVMLLLRRLGASLEEQVAGLLHDVSHTAFSHVADYLFGNVETEDYQDSQHERFIRESELPEIIENHGFSVDRIGDHHLFSLLEQDKPDLCADRVDYALRQFSKEAVEACLPGFVSFNNKICCQTKASAKTFAEAFLSCQVNSWGSYESVSRYKILAQMLKRAVELELIVEEDLWKTDEELLKVMEESDDAYLKRGFAVLSQKDLSNISKETERTVKKFRYVDPMIVESGKRLSEVDSDFADELSKRMEESKAGFFAADPMQL